MSNTSIADLGIIFNNVQWYFQHIILPICFVLGNIGNCLNLIILSQRSSRSNSCLLYFLSASIVNIFILNFGLVLRILRGIWNIDPSTKFLWFCRWRTYLISTLFLIYRCSILLACIDRMCASSRSACMRTTSRSQVAYRLIAINWILCCVYFIPTLVFPVIIYGQCLAPPGTTYATFLTISTLAQGLFIPLFMILYGLITLGHLKLMQSHVMPMTFNVNNERRVIGQFLIMLFVQVGTDCLCNSFYLFYLIYNLIFSPPQMAPISVISSFLSSMSFNVPYLNYSAAFYLYTLSSPTFRRKVLRLMRQITWFQ
ncbi:unnamed protein product [Rotaria sp. Silwood2]|nr:unnamed protein product [Rotaria sp. Silwood2]CAF3171646.1 unnamed protein product [Rotaria sp. Silwood2]CAF4241410.1 unnamed protein product [Rotaria sp. Silwood2]CAF4559600.1 unnamed protein product [Rotaria sp. Silwood2]